MAVYCSRCVAQNRHGAEFCADCGAPLAPEDIMAEAAAAVDRRAELPIGSLVLDTICLVYLINPTAGVLELIPDNLPILLPGRTETDRAQL